MAEHAAGEIWITHLNTDPDLSECYDIDNDGMPGIGLAGTAIQFWLACQNRVGVTCSEVARAFNLPVELVRQAVADHPYMFIVANDVIEEDGEG